MQSNSSSTRSSIPPAAQNFDALPDSAQIGIRALMAVTSKSRATIYRWIEKRVLPAPRKYGNSQNVWLVGEVRRVLAGEVAQ